MRKIKAVVGRMSGLAYPDQCDCCGVLTRVTYWALPKSRVCASCWEWKHGRGR